MIIDVERLQEIPRIYTAIAEWGVCLLYCILLPRKVVNGKFAVAAVISLVVQSLFLGVTKDVPQMLWLVVMVAAVGLMFLFLYVVCAESVKMICYVCAKAFLIAEFTASLEWQIAYFINEKAGLTIVQHVFLMLVIYAALLGLFFYIEKSLINDTGQFEISRKEFFSVFIIVVSAFAFSNISFLSRNTPFSGGTVMDILNIRTLGDLGGIAVLFAYQSRIFELSAEKELMAIHSMLQTQYDNYRNYADSIELINMKYHDLKHQIAGLRTEISPECRLKWIDAIEEELQAYHPDQQTGNEVLDTLLSGKIGSCSKEKIKFTCVADGELLNFMHVKDICTIFGNALDNAVENVLLVEDPEKRLIHMSVSAKKQFVFISVSNYCDHQVELKNGFPVTTKIDKANHGFGIKSMDYTVKKYNGSMTFGVDKEMFELRILIPMQQ